METEAACKKSLIKIVKLLFYNPLERGVILNELNIKSNSLSKYFDIIRRAGFYIIRQKNKYSIQVHQGSLILQEYEKSLIAYAMCLMYNGLSLRKLENFEKILNKIMLLSDKESSSTIFERFKLYKKLLLSNEYSQKINLIEKYIKEKTLIYVATSKEEVRLLCPVSIDWDKIKLCVNFIDKQTLKTYCIPIEKIAKIAKTDQKPIEQNTNETIFELYGKLSKSYVLKENERIIDSFRNKLVIANHSKDKEALFRRLLKYDTFCKVILPREDVKKFTKLIDISIENLDKLKDNISDFIKV